MFYSQDLIDKVRRDNPIDEVIATYTQLQGKTALCIFHDDAQPSLSVSPEKGIAKCFVCMDKAVDAFGFVMKAEKVSFPEAVKILAEKSNIQLPNFTTEDRQLLEKHKVRENLLAEASDFYHKNLLPLIGKIGYLKTKGISNEMISRFKIGYAQGGLRKYLLGKGFSEDAGVEVGVLTVRQGGVRDFFEEAIVFPVTVRGRVVSLTGRMLSNNSPSKFMHLKGEINCLFNEDALLDASEIIICEGPVDTITAVQYGLTAVGIFGAQGFKESYLSKFKNIKDVFGCLDADEAGWLGMKRLDQIFNGDVNIIRLPEGMDLNDYFNK